MEQISVIHQIDSINYQLLGIVGKGAYGVVYRAIHLLSNIEVAVKCIEIDITSVARMRCLIREILIM
jgi:serine/threonine protein kinase